MTRIFAFLRSAIVLIGKLTLVVVVVTLITLNHVHAAELDTLAAHIDRLCDKHCVDADLLRIALHQGAAETHVDPLWFLAVIQTESNFSTKAVNRRSGRSVGLSQIQVRWHRDKFLTKHYADVFENVRVGMTILGDCQEQYNGNMRKALWCYNGHQPGGLKRYADKVVKLHHLLKHEHIAV